MPTYLLGAAAAVGAAVLAHPFLLAFWLAYVRPRVLRYRMRRLSEELRGSLDSFTVGPGPGVIREFGARHRLKITGGGDLVGVQGLRVEWVEGAERVRLELIEARFRAPAGRGATVDTEFLIWRLPVGLPTSGTAARGVPAVADAWRVATDAAPEGLGGPGWLFGGPDGLGYVAELHGTAALQRSQVTAHLGPLLELSRTLESAGLISEADRFPPA